MDVKVKICGITNIEDALFACKLGAYAIGFVFFKDSKRYILPEKAEEISKRLPVSILKIGVFVNNAYEEILDIKRRVMLDMVQIYNEELIENGLDPNIAIMGYRIRCKEDIERAKQSKALPLLDAFHELLYGGTGISFEWSLIGNFGRPFILAGGINPENIRAALTLKPFVIDISSGCEKAPGVKDHKKMSLIFNILKNKRDK